MAHFGYPSAGGLLVGCAFLVFGKQFSGGIPLTRNVLAVIGLTILIVVQGLAGGPLARWLLEQEVRGTTASWAAHIFKQVEAGVTRDESGARGAPNAKSYVNLAGALEAALRAGVIHRAVIFNEACNCLVTIEGSVLLNGDAGIADRLHSFFAGVGEQAKTPSMGMSGAEWRAFVANVESTGPSVSFSTSDRLGEPPQGAEVTYVRKIAGEKFALCLIIDVTGSMTRLRLMLTMGAMILTLTLVGASILIGRIATHSNRALQISEKQARFLAEHDPLTGLLNRFGFGLRAARMLKDCAAQGHGTLLFQVDADKFKEINDIYGHATGDRVIQAIGQMLKGAFSASALVARLGGDEFAVLVPAEEFTGPSGKEIGALPTGTDVLSDDGHKLIEVSTSIGLAAFPKDADTLGDLMKAADLALYSVKAAGRNAVGAYRRDMTKALERRHWEVEGVRDAIRQGHLIPYYQPLVNARTGRIESVEALARWRHPTYGVLAPARFSHALKDPRVSTEITREILFRAADDLKHWHMAGHDISVGLNIGEADLREPDFVGMVSATLNERGLPLRSLAIEVTETALTRVNSADAHPLLERFRAAGGCVALDDFGTGNSSITLLKDMPYSAVKIDRSFIRDLTHNQADLAIVRSIVRLSRELGFKIVAEGIETVEQAHLLRKLRVDMLQGFLYSRPLPAGKLIELLDWASPPPRKPAPPAASATTLAVA